MKSELDKMDHDISVAKDVWLNLRLNADVAYQELLALRRQRRALKAKCRKGKR